MIPQNITREHILEALKEIKRKGVPYRREPTKFHLLHDGEQFPPKYVISLANKFANDRELEPSQFSGGHETNSFLRELGFEIVEKAEQNWLRVWLEKVYVKGKRHKEQGEYALGEALLSPQKDRRGADIYQNMRLAEKGDLVLHLTDNEAIVGISKIKEEYDATPGFVYLREWDNQTGKDPGYLIRLEGFIRFKNPIDRQEILNEKFKDQLISILDFEGNVFYNKDLKLRQGAYLTRIPDKLMTLINSIYREKNGSDLPYWRGHPRIALIGPTDWEYLVRVEDFIERLGQVCSTWTYPLSEKKIELLRKQMPFYLYCYITKSSGGSGLVECKLRVKDFVISESEIPCPNPEYCAYDPNQPARRWYTFDRIEKISPHRALESFELFDKEENLTQNAFSRMRNPDSEFIYVKDVEMKDELISSKGIDFMESLKSLLEEKKQIVLYGPPGTGKTYKARAFSEWFFGKAYEELSETGQVEFITFHPSYSYEEFVEGITVNTNQESKEADSGEIQYIQKWGVFKKICAKALAKGMGEKLDPGKDPWEDQWSQIYERYLEKIQGKAKEEINNEIWNDAEKLFLIIDEINRGDISKTFGELVTLLEKDKRLAQDSQIVVQLPYSNDKFGVPPNIYVIGTMNTADRSIALVDIALRRRFGFVEMAPDFEVLRFEHIERNEDQLKENEVYDYLDKSVSAVGKINKNIIDELGRDKQIGHSFFFKVFNQKDLMMVWQHEILPLLEEYYYCDY
ncbi:MAG: McrB family protein, partial [Candidatus Hodarchaeota archaeon]